jgi:hypothetical protein
VTLNIDRAKLTIMDVPFDNKRDFRDVWHALSTNMFEGWEPSRVDVLRLKEKAAKLREEANVSQTI